MKKVVLKKLVPVDPVATLAAAEPVPSVPVLEVVPQPAAPTASAAPATESLVPEAGSAAEKAVIEKALRGDADALFQMALISRPPRGSIDVAAHWATLAQTQALRDIANELGNLNDFLGAYDEPEKDDEGDEGPEPRMADQITEGILGAVAVLKDEFGDGALTALASMAPKGNG